VGGLAVATLAVQGINLTRSPRPSTGEGALVAASWAVGHASSIADATFSPALPSLAPVQLAIWGSLSDALGRAPAGIGTGREAMLAAQVAGVILLWVLARCSGLSRWASAVAVGTFTLLPLGVTLHRPVASATLAVPWLLAAWVLVAGTLRARPAGWIAAGVCLSVAALTEPAAIVVVPVVLWQLWRAGGPHRGRATLVVGAVGAAVAGPLAALSVAAERPAAGSALGLVDRVWLALGTRPGDSALAALAGPTDTLGDLLGVDPVGVLGVVVSAVAVPLILPRLRPVAVAFWALAALFVVGDQPVANVAVLALPFGALLVGAAVHTAWGWYEGARLDRGAAGYRASPVVAGIDAAVPVALVVGLAVLAAAVPHWASTHRELTSADPLDSLEDARSWLLANARDGERVIVDDAAWTDLVAHGIPPRRLAGYTAIGATAGDTGGWRTYDYIVLTPEARGLGVPAVAAAATSSLPVASFGEMDDRVEIRRIAADGGPAVSDEAATRLADQVAAGTALASNPAIEAPDSAYADLRAGRVDQRVITVVATLAATYRLSIDSFPTLPGEDVAVVPSRAVDLAAIDGRAIRGDDPGVVGVLAFLGNQDDAFRPESIAIVPADGGELRLRITFPISVGSGP
jgi:hypothetical protein